MIAILLLIQNVTIALPPSTEAAPATSWSCSFNDAEGDTFTLKGFVAEAPVGTNPNVGISTSIEGSGPRVLLGSKMIRPHVTRADLRSYQISFDGPGGSRYNINLNLAEQRAGMATITHFVPGANSDNGKLKAFAAGYCGATFHPLGYQGTGQ